MMTGASCTIRQRNSRWSRQQKPSDPSCWGLRVVLVLLCAATTLSSHTTLAVLALNAASPNFGYDPDTDVSMYLRLALDIKSMRMATNISSKEAIYNFGNHSSISLASLSLNAKTDMKDVPMYNIYLASFRDLGVNQEDDSLGSFDGQPVEQYADTLMNDMFQLALPNLEGTGAVVWHILMSYWSRLWKLSQSCKEEDPNNMIAYLDQAVALWVGEGQVRRDNQKGYLLYNLAEFAGQKFGQDHGESIVNSETLQIFNTIKTNKNICALKSGYVTIRNQVQTLMDLSNIILVQMLLHSIQDVVENQKPSDFVEVFSLALEPQIEFCDLNAYNTLTNLTITHDMAPESHDAAISLIQGTLDCLGLTCNDVGSYLTGRIVACDDNSTTTTLSRMAGYVPRADVRDIARLDRDVKQMDIFMQHGQWDLAFDYYMYGWNSEITLSQVASGTLPWINSDDLFKYNNKYTPDFVDLTVREALINDPQVFANTLEQDRYGLVKGMLQSVVLPLGAMGHLTTALTACDSNDLNQAKFHWDAAAAILIGSIEGQEPGGQEGGQSIFNLSKYLCQFFNTCEPTGSIDGTVLVASLQGGASGIALGECEEPSNIIDEKIRKAILVPIIQGVLFSTLQSATAATATSTPLPGIDGYLFAFTAALVPYIYDTSPAAVFSLEENTRRLTDRNVAVNVTAAFDAIRISLPSLQIDCAQIGQITVNGMSAGVCPNDSAPLVTNPQPAGSTTIVPQQQQPATTTAPLPPKQPTAAPLQMVTTPPVQSSPVAVQPGGLAWGRYQFVHEYTAVQDSLFTLDVKDMYFSDTPQAAKVIYQSPSLNAVNGLYGHPQVKSLQDLSTKASLFMSQDPMYNFYRVALFEDESFDGNANGADNGWPYADAVEQLAVGPSNGNSAQLGARTATVMEIWMMIANRLYEAVRNCEKKIGSPELIDSAVGLWIGQDQQQGKFNCGWSLYSVSQEAAQFYGHPEVETKENKELMSLFNQAQTLSQSCTSNSATAAESLRTLVDDMLRHLSVPLLQHLLFHMSDDTFEYIELYALSFIPQTISVDEGAYNYLRDALFEGFDWDSTVDTEFLSTMGKVLHAMRFTCDNLGDISAANDKLKGLVTVLCNEIDMTYDSSLMAAYETSSDVKELARIDQDILQIDIFMRANVYDLAYSVYTKGRNSKANGGGYNTLQRLAISDQNLDAGQVYQSFISYHRNSTYADQIISQILMNPQDSRFAGSSRRQRSEAVRRTLQNMVMYIHIVARLKGAIGQCESNTSNQLDSNGVAVAGQQLVDQAVALYVGSIEGPFSGGDIFYSGQMMYALAKDMCKPFEKCDTHGDADANVFLLYAFSNVKEALDESNCVAADSVVDDSVLAMLPVPLIQATLFFADKNDGLPAQSPNSTLAAGNIVAETILPLIKEVNETSAAKISSSMDFDPMAPSVRSGKKVVFDAFVSVLQAMGVDCTTVGTLVSAGLSVCDDGKFAPAPTTTTNLGGDLYISTTYVQNRADIALDIKQMEDDLLMGKVGAAQYIYKAGENSAIYDEQGKKVDLRTLAAFSTDAAETMGMNPLFQIAVYALGDENDKYLGEEATEYANTIVEEMFVTGASSQEPLASEAAVALNLWMELANELFQTVEKCKSRELTDEDGIHSIDEAVAYWVGDGQIAGDSENGHLLYALAEKMGEHFQTDSTGSSRLNDNILRLFHQAKIEVSLSNGCSQSPNTARRVRHVVDKITSQMMVVLVQALIHYLRSDGERDRVRIYAHAFVPLVAGCSPETFKFLKEKLIDSPYHEVEVEEIITVIRSTFPCFDLKCDDVGIHTTEPKAECTDPSNLRSYATYKPANDVREYAQLDLDILELDILMQTKSFDAAEELYSFGKHASMSSGGDGTALSLAYLATTAGRTVVPQFDSFQRYFGNDDRYADTIIRQAFSDSAGLDDIQKRAVVIKTTQVMIMYMASLQALHDSVGSCTPSQAGRGSATAKNWDKVAALLIGDLEGSSNEGSTEGLLLWNLSKQHCDEFKTCSDLYPGSSKTNDKIVTLLYSGRGAVLAGSCDELRKVAYELAPLFQIPLIQASLSATRTLSLRSPQEERIVAQAEAYVYAQSLLPVIEDIDRDTAKLIRDNFPLNGQPMRDGVRAVAGAYASIISELGIDCHEVGSNDEIDTCTGAIQQMRTPKLMLVVGIILASVTVFALFVLLRSRRTDLQTENSPEFVRSKGELNHNDDLLATPESSGGSDRDEDLQQDGDVEYIRAIENALLGESEDERRTPEVV